MRISSQDSKIFLKKRQEYIKRRSVDLATTEQIVSDMVSSERSRPSMFDSLGKSEDFQFMREKLTSLRGKVQNFKNNTIDTGNWHYTRREEHKKKAKDLGIVSPRTSNPVKELGKTIATPRINRKVKRVPPPNFMIGMRDLTRVYAENENTHIIVHNRYLN